MSFKRILIRHPKKGITHKIIDFKYLCTIESQEIFQLQKCDTSNLSFETTYNIERNFELKNIKMDFKKELAYYPALNKIKEIQVGSNMVSFGDDFREISEGFGIRINEKNYIINNIEHNVNSIKYHLSRRKNGEKYILTVYLDQWDMPDNGHMLLVLDP